MAEHPMTDTPSPKPPPVAISTPAQSEQREAASPDPRSCLIRTQCLWRAQGGDAVCAACRYVVTEDKATGAGPMTRSVV